MPTGVKLRIEEMHILALDRDGAFLSSKYKNCMELRTWQCSKGHVWEARPTDIKSKKTWCPVCAGKKKHTLQDAIRLARSKGGTCLSKEYKNTDTLLLFKCA